MPRAALHNLMQIILHQPRLSRTRERELLKKLRNGDKSAAQELVTSHLRFVLHIARRYKSHGHPLAELIQEGTVGLMEALKRFNPDKGTRLSTYAMWWIRAAIQDYVIRSRSLVKIGTTAAQKSLFLNIRRRMAERPWEESLPEELARFLATRFNTSVTDVVKFARRIRRPDQSLDFPAGQDGSATFVDQVIDDRPTPEDTLIKDRDSRYWRDRLVSALSSLPPRESFIIRRRFLADRTPSRADLGAELGLSKERVRQLEVRALAKLKGLLQPLREHAEAAGQSLPGKPPRIA
ncbi:MAG: RNA polymerase factor sigma-32 [Rhodospirillaceae bacterium]|nr:RNA polymerase factor sigma-32 [Rhodospirillaceae bacterium]|tara:strand:- start:8613 stop:9491 length:879 start_codon:yes stop_codon:yes gene_type:complete